MFLFKNASKTILLIIVILLGAICMFFGSAFIYLNRFNADIINGNLKKATPITIGESKMKDPIRIDVKEFSETSLAQVPSLMQQLYVKRGGLFTFKQRSSNKIRYILIDLLGIYMTYDPDISTKLAHNSLVIHNKAWPLLSEENFLASKILEKYSKEEILEHYLNQIYFGQGVFGIGAASYHYFGKSISSLQIHQIAFLASISDDIYSKDMKEWKPLIKTPEELRRMRNEMIDLMERLVLITRQQAKEEKEKSLDIIVKLKKS